MSIVAAAPAARAASVAKVALTGVVRSDSNGNESPGSPVRVGDLVKLSFEWDARGMDLAEADSFTIALPPVFGTYEHPHSSNLTISGRDGDATIGECDATASAITCTFTSKVEELRKAGDSHFSGSGTVLLRAVEETDQAAVTFTAGGQTASVDLPGGKIEPEPTPSHAPAQLTTWASPVTKSSSTIVWSAVFGSDFLAGKLADSESQLDTDGQARSTLVLTETLGAGQTFSTDLSRWVFAMRTNSSSSEETPLTLGDGTDRETDAYGDFDLDVQLTGSKATITITGPFAADTNYRLSFPTKVDSSSGTVKPGQAYSSTVKVDGTDLEAKASRRYTDSLAVTAQATTSYGSFSVFTLLRGGAAATISEDTVFPIEIEYSLPSGTTAESYPGWTAPGTLNSDKTGGKALLKASAGSVSDFDGTFPVGTKVTFSEKLPEAPEGVIWGRPMFTVGTETIDSLVIREETTKVNLTNEASMPSKLDSDDAAQAAVSPTQAGASSDPADAVAGQQTSDPAGATTSGLARTGMSVEAIGVLAIVLLMGGLYLALHKRGKA